MNTFCKYAQQIFRSQENFPFVPLGFFPGGLQTVPMRSAGRLQWLGGAVLQRSDTESAVSPSNTGFALRRRCSSGAVVASRLG